MRAIVIAILCGCSYTPAIGVADGTTGDVTGDTAGDAAGDTAGDSTVAPVVVGPNLLVTSADGQPSRRPSLEWTGTEFGLAWDDQRDGNEEIYFRRLDATGAAIGGDVRITNESSVSVEVSLVSTGAMYGLVWRDERDGNKEIYFARVNAAGVKVGADVRVTTDGANSERPSITWTGSEFAIVWNDDRDGNKEIYAARISSAGVKQGTDVRVTNAMGNSERASIAWTGAELVIAWNDDRDGNKEIYVTRLSAAGSEIGDDIRLTNAAGSSERPSIAWTGAEVAIAWNDDRDGNKEVYITRTTPTGVEIGDDVRVTTAAGDSTEVSLLWTGATFAASWTDTRDGNDEIYIVTRGASGEARTGELRTTDDVAGSKESSLAGAGPTFGIAWTDTRSGTEEIWFLVGAL